MFRKIYFLPSIITILLPMIGSSCSDRPKEVLSDKQMVELLSEMNLADAYKDNGSGQLPDSVRNNLGEGILAAHGYTYAQLDTTLKWYGQHLDKYYDLLDKVDKTLLVRQKRIDHKAGDKSSIDQQNSGENIWVLSDHYWFSQLGNTSGMYFDIAGDQVEKGESLLWKFRVHNNGSVKVYLGVEYEDGSTSYTSGGNNGENQVKLTLLTDTLHKVKRIIGNIYVDRDRMPLWVDSIRMLRQPYDSIKYSSTHYQKVYSK